MEKTPEELQRIKDAVLAEAQRVWNFRVNADSPRRSFWHPKTNPLNFIDGLYPISVTPSNSDGKRDGWNIGSQYGHNINFAPIWLGENLQEDHIFWLIAYRLLGLEARDAVKEYESSLRQDLTNLLTGIQDIREGRPRKFVPIEEFEREQARAAALLEALEEINSVSDNPDRTDAEVRFKVFDVSESALEAYKKGGEDAV